MNLHKPGLRSPGILMVVVLAALGGCASVPGETLGSRAAQSEARTRVLALSNRSAPQCARQRITDTEVVDLHPNGKVAAESWTVDRCGERARYHVSFSPSGRVSDVRASAE